MDKLQKEKPKMESQINSLKQLLSDQYLLSKSFKTKNNERNDIQQEYDEIKQSLNSTNYELQT